MGIHHLALATRDAKANHEFYTGPMGFELAKVEVGRAGQDGWAKHLFYDTGAGGMVAFWDIHDADLPDGWTPAIATGLGLPGWTNHVAFDAADLDDIERRKQRWIDHGLNCWEIDHGWCYSIYTMDPNEIMVEFCVSTREFTDADRQEALALLANEHPEVGDPPAVHVHKGRE